MPSLSLLVPIYNAAATLQRSLDSVLAQTYSDFECLLIDDGSTDASLSICQQYAHRDSRFKVFTKPNEGEYSARNLGLRHMQGEYLCYLDADDQLLPEYLQTLVSCLNDTESVDLVFQGIVRCCHDVCTPELPGRDGIYSLTPDPLPFYQSVNVHRLGYSFSKLFRTSIIRQNALEYSSQITLAVDLDFLLRYLRHCRHVVVASQAHYKYIIRSGSLTYSINSFAREYSGLQQLSSSWHWWTTRCPEKALYDKEGASVALLVQRCISSCYKSKVGFLERRKNLAQLSDAHIEMYHRYADESTVFLRAWKWLFCHKQYLLLDLLLLFVFRVVHKLK